jgi:hypothetical protein
MAMGNALTSIVVVNGQITGTWKRYRFLYRATASRGSDGEDRRGPRISYATPMYRQRAE